MDKDKESRTEEESYIEERIFGDHHHKTTISDGHKKAEGRGRTSEESQKVASDKWDSGETSDSWCFISTACTESKELPDDCKELNCLRHFRDLFVSNLPNGDELIKEYYEVAPKIVSAINKTKHPEKVYSRLYEELVSKTVNLINSNQKQEAFNNCISIVRELEQEYLR